MPDEQKKSSLCSPFVRIARIRPGSVGRVALLLVGEVRTLEFCLKRQLEKIQGAASVHVFLATWDKTKPSIREAPKTVFEAWRNPSVIRADFTQQDVTVNESDLRARYPQIEEVKVINQEAVVQDHHNLAQSVALDEELANKTRTTPEFKYRDVFVTLNQFYLLEKTITLMLAAETETGRVFDYVIRSRPDIVFNRKILWPLDGELIIDCLKSTRRSKGAIFDGFFVSPRHDVEVITMLYQQYVDLLNKKDFLQAFEYTYHVKIGAIELLYKRLLGPALLVNETEVRRNYAALPDLDLVDARLGVRIVR